MCYRLFKLFTFGSIILFFSPFRGFTQSIESFNFKEVMDEFPRTEKNLRKWDNPIISDLDQDGYQDLLLNDHGVGLQVQWNNHGKFTKPFDIIMGDIHGVSVSDYDKDGNLEIIISRGGGSGSNARNAKIFKVNKKREFLTVPDFKVPLELMRGRTVKFYDGDNDGDIDLLNFAFPDASKKGKSENYIYKNNGRGELILSSTLPPSKIDGQKTLITDFNNDAISDILMYGFGTVKAFKGKGDLTYEDVTNEIFPKSIDYVTGISEIDYDNDGDFDLYFTRGKEFEIGETFYDKETKLFGFYTKRGEFQFEVEVGDVLTMENFQSQWPNNDTFFIGESSYNYNFEGETHSGKNIRLVNSDAFGFPENVNYKDKKGWYIGYIGNNNWRLAGFLWAPATGIISNVKNYPQYKHSEGLNDILLRNNKGKFEDVTKKTQLYLEEHTEGVSVADFDNNGYQDLLIVRRGNLINENEALVYLNNRECKFKQLINHQINSPELGAIGMAVDTFDYNQDGKVDVIIGNDRGKWHLFENCSSIRKNNFIIVNVGKSLSNKISALGAIVTIESCGLKQKQRVGASGSPYSQGFDNLVHFGLNTCLKPVKIKVSWTNGDSKTLTISKLNQQVKIGV